MIAPTSCDDMQKCNRIKTRRIIFVNFWLLTLTLINLLLITFIIFNWFIRAKINQDDQRLTKGLQLLQNKISILQDLSDKSDEQVRRWVHLIEQKSTDVQSKLMQSDEKIEQIECVLSKALDVSKIFYDQVPHAEIVERQKTSKYVQAAKLANQGFTADQIAQKIELGGAEIDMIIKMNREKLQFSEENLPAWVQQINSNQDAISNEPQMTAHQQEIQDFSLQLKKMNQMVSSTAFDMPKPDMASMDHIKQQFNETIAKNSIQIPQTFLDEKNKEIIYQNGKTIRPFEFKKIGTTKN